MKILKVEAMQRRTDYSSRRSRAEMNETTRIYFSFKGETIMDNLMNRRTRPFNELRTYLPAALEQLGYKDAVSLLTAVKWSSKAGCKMCPCSPGFVMSRTLFDNETARPLDIWVTVADDDYVEPEVLPMDPSEDLDTTG